MMVAVLFMSVSVVSAQDLDTAQIKEIREAAEQGDADAQNNLGVMYANGYGVAENYAEAVKWYRKAAEQGDASAQYEHRRDLPPRAYSCTNSCTNADRR
ncbi:MAG TPA: sel1 repeat family protein [Myxococcales bacterium]|nr:sel1 repeat family protein [Myxococcales bacterium]